ncbi:MAG TPA: sulfur reduction protein DsrS [Gammaproteobacteria bacterium]|nr:sulfur reduction protein DsrS [Gammaproteobacteria bacterium]
MDLTAEDDLRVNVLLAGSLKAVRIDESKMTLHALSDKGEAKIQLNPNCREESYLRRVRETLSSHILGSPGGYPVYLKRWTRMGQARDSILESLLLLGEPEAVVAVVNAPGITDEIASRAWWASQTSENARCMLRQEAVVQGRMGPVLAQFLLEFLPFEEEARDQIRSVRLVLQGELIDPAERQRLWEKGKHRNAFHVGFLQALPDDLPDEQAPGPAWEQVGRAVEALMPAGNPFAMQLCRLLGPAGQSFLAAVESVLKKPSNQDVVVELMHALAAHARDLPVRRTRLTRVDEIDAVVDQLLAAAGQGDEACRDLADVLQELPGNVHHIRAMLFLGLLDEPLLDPVFAGTDAIGSVMRKKLEPVTGPVLQQIAVLKGL